MTCNTCGATLNEDSLICPCCGTRNPQESPTAEAALAAQPAPEPVLDIAETPETPEPVKQNRKKPHLLVRLLMQLLSFVLSVVLLAAVVCTVVLADLHVLTSSGGINKLFDTVLQPTSAPGVARSGGTLPGNLSEQLTDGLADYVFALIEEQLGEELPFGPEELKTVIQKSTVTEFVSRKLESYLGDFMRGTTATVITPTELLELLEENQQLLEQELGITITEDFKQEFFQAVDQLIEESKLNTVIHETVNSAIDDILGQSSAVLGGLHAYQVRQIVALAASNQLLYIAIGICILLLLLLCLANWYNVPAGLNWACSPCVVAGLILSAPVFVVLEMPQLLLQLLGSDFANVLSVIVSVVSVLAPVHYGLLATGVGLFVISLIWRLIRAIVRRCSAKAPAI